MIHPDWERRLRLGNARLPKRVRKLAGWLAMVWLLFALLAYFVAPPLAKSLLTDKLSQALGREVSIQAISINPLTLSAQVNGFSVKDRSGGEQLGFEQLSVNFSGFSVAQAGIVVDEIRLQSPRVAIARLAEGRYDISDLLDPWLAPSNPGRSPLPRFSFNNIQISNGRFELDDRPKGLRHEAKAIAFSLPFISNMPYKAEVFVLPAFSATVDGSSLSLKGKSQPFATSHASELELQLQGLDLARLQPYLPSSLPVRIQSGQLGTALTLGFFQQADGTATVSLRGTAQLQAVQMSDSDRHFLALNQLVLELENVDQKIPSSTSTERVVRADRLALQASGLRFEDRSVSPAAVQNLAQLKLTMDKPDSMSGHPNAFTLSAQLSPSGKLQAGGTLQWQPLAVRMQLDAQAVPLSPLQGYLNAYLNGTVVQGLLSSLGDLDIQEQEGVRLATYKGNLTLGQFSATDEVNHRDVLKWKSLYFGAMDWSLAPPKLNIGEIALTDFDAHLTLNPDGRLNLADRVRLPSGPASAIDTPGNAGPARPLPLQIAKVTLQNGHVVFSDHFVRPNYTANITRLGGIVKNLSSTADTLADLDLRGSYAGNAPVHISASLNPLADRKFLDLKADASSIDLVDFSPYAGKYAGYKIDKGKLSLNATYKLENRQLMANNRLFIDQLTFGEKVDSPQATQLPVHLAIALLKNNRGEIDIHLPISGSLDDPQFSIGGLIFKVIANLFVKAVSSPFTLLGSLFGDGQSMSHIGFAPGRADLDEAALKTMETLARAMREREGLKLEISGGADQQIDAEGLRKAALKRAMQAEKRKDIPHTPRESVSPQDLQITSDEYATYLTRAYQQARFPKPRNLIGMAKALPVPEMEKLLLTHQSVGEEDLRALATARAQAAQSWLVEQGGLEPGRIFLLPIQIGEASSPAPEAGRNQVDFSLR